MPTPHRAPFDFYTRALARILSDAWHEASTDWRKRVVAAIKQGDTKAVKTLARQGKSIGTHMRGGLRTPVAATLLATQRKAAKHWDELLLSHPKKFAKAPAPTPVTAATSILNDPSRRDKLRQIKQNQIESFAESFPERILDPEIERMIDLMDEYETAREIDLLDIADRAERMLESESYWNQLSNVEISRLWHGDGVALAGEQGITRMQIVAILDDLTCPVCVIMHGNEVDVQAADDKYNDDDQDGEIDPDDYVANWPFPRFNEVQMFGPEDITESGYLPPFHPGSNEKGGCRCTLRPIF